MASAVRPGSVENTSARPSSPSEMSRGSGRTNVDAAPLELHVAHDRRAQGPERMRERGAAIPRRERFARGAAADHRATFQDEWLPAPLREIKGGYQRVVPPTDNDDVAHVRR